MPKEIFLPRRSKVVASLMVLTLPLVSACAPDLGPLPEPKAVENYDAAKTLKAAERAWPKADWWVAYNDPQLTSLIEEAVKGAPEVRIADARLRAAVAAQSQARGALGIASGAEAMVPTVKQSLNTGFPDEFKTFLPKKFHVGGQVDVQAYYDFDIAGKNRARLAAATSEADAAAVEARAARLSLSTAVATAYADLVRLTVERDMAASAIRVRKDSLALVTARVKQGLDTKAAAAQAEAALETAKTRSAAIDGQISLVRNQIAALLGKGPDRGQDIALPKRPDVRPIGVPANLPAELLGRRPDIVAARLRVEAAAERIKVARADFYPNINLTGLLGLQAFDIADVLTGDSLMGHFGPAIQLPLFPGDSLKGALKGARATYAMEVAQYDRTVTTAFKDVADVLASEKALSAQTAHARAAETAAEQAWRLIRLRYKGGLARYSEVLQAEDSLLGARTQVANLEAQTFAEDIALVRALGGGFGS